VLRYVLRGWLFRIVDRIVDWRLSQLKNQIGT